MPKQLEEFRHSAKQQCLKTSMGNGLGKGVEPPVRKKLEQAKY
jgi:hypothetical protein